MSQPAHFLATARGGHSADPAARCPYCQQPVGLHQGVLIGPKESWFPVRVLVCVEAEVPKQPECSLCDDKRFVDLPGPGGVPVRVACVRCNASPRAVSMAVAEGQEIKRGALVAVNAKGEAVRAPTMRCTQCGSPPALHAVAGTNLRCTHCGHAWAMPFPAARPPELTRCATCDGRRWITNDVPCTNCNPRGELHPCQCGGARWISFPNSPRTPCVVCNPEGRP